MNIFQIIGSLLFRSKKAVENTVSHEMQTALDQWLSFYQYGDACSDPCGSLRLPSAVASEVARLVLAESEFTVNGNAFLDMQMQRFAQDFAYKAEAAFALGSMAFKPYVSGGKILVDLVRADRYLPVAYDHSGYVTAAVFLEQKTIGKKIYTRLESHKYDADMHSYSVENKAFCSLSEDTIGRACSLAEVDGWELLQDEQQIDNIECPLFTVFKVPAANHIDLDSPLGTSVFADATELIREANAQWKRILWEFSGTELAVEAEESLFAYNRKAGRLRRQLAAGKERLFRKYDIAPGEKLSDKLQVFSPAIRDSSLFNGFNKILQRIEFNCGLAYGTLSDPQMVEKTAEEIRSSKQRSYVQVSRIQKSLACALEQLLYAMQIYAGLYGLGDATGTLACAWGDSVLEDWDKTFQRRLMLAQSGFLKPEYILADEFGCDEETARKMMPETGLQAAAGSLFGG